MNNMLDCVKILDNSERCTYEQHARLSKVPDNRNMLFVNNMQTQANLKCI